MNNVVGKHPGQCPDLALLIARKYVDNSQRVARIRVIPCYFSTERRTNYKFEFFKLPKRPHRGSTLDKRSNRCYDVRRFEHNAS